MPYPEVTTISAAPKGRKNFYHVNNNDRASAKQSDLELGPECDFLITPVSCQISKSITGLRSNSLGTLCLI